MLPRLSRWFKRRAANDLYARLLGLEDRLNPGAGQFDPAFGMGGLVTTLFPFSSDDRAAATAIDSMGRILVAGNAYYGNYGDAVVVRYTSTGAQRGRRGFPPIQKSLCGWEHLTWASACQSRAFSVRQRAIR